MKTCSILEEIAEKGSDKSDIAGRVAAAPELVPELLTGLTDKRADVRFGCDKILGLLAERAPEVLYPHIESFITNVEHPNTILRWGAIAVLGRLAAVDEPRRIDALVPELLEPIAGPVLVTAVKCIEATARIALAKPEFTDRVVEGLLNVESAEYKTPECRNIAIGAALEALEELAGQTSKGKSVKTFVKRQCGNTRASTRRKAERLLKKLEGKPPAE